ncbi:hypothetical protein DV735_g976, partial [Chaetothyriales sp. CBS 134920]
MSATPIKPSSSPPEHGKGKSKAQAEPKYNVYHVSFTQPRAPDHQAIVLVDSESSDQGRGMLVHVTGDVGLGMQYRTRGQYNFLHSRSYKSHEFVGTMLQSNEREFLDIAKSIDPPHDPEVMFGKKPPREDCATWIAELKRRTRHLRST